MLRIWGWEGRAENIKLGKKFKAEFLAIARLVSWCFRPSQPQRSISGLTAGKGHNDNKKVCTDLDLKTNQQNKRRKISEDE